MHFLASNSGIDNQKGAPLFRGFDARRQLLTGRRLNARDALDLVKRRAGAAGPGEEVCNHTFRANNKVHIGVANLTQ